MYMYTYVYLSERDRQTGRLTERPTEKRLQTLLDSHTCACTCTCKYTISYYNIKCINMVRKGQVRDQVIAGIITSIVQTQSKCYNLLKNALSTTHPLE